VRLFLRSKREKVLLKREIQCFCIIYYYVVKVVQGLNGKKKELSINRKIQGMNKVKGYERVFVGLDAALYL